MRSTPATIACLTDFGTQDAFVGIMKGVIARSGAEVRFLDLTHEIPPGDIRQGGIRLWQAAPHLPDDTIYLAVVDPGVGTTRRGVALAWERARAVGPDNGLFTHLIDLLGQPDSVELIVPPSRGCHATFHGRDVFAPAAASLAADAPLHSLGHAIETLVLLPPERLDVLDPHTIQGEVLFPDHFGNLVTSIGILEDGQDHVDLIPWVRGARGASLPAAGLAAFLPDGRALPLRRTFGEAAPGEALAYIGSDGLLELAVNQGRAADVLSLAPGAPILLKPRG
jgi:S-adenosylmethionine hydrolase